MTDLERNLTADLARDVEDGEVRHMTISRHWRHGFAAIYVDTGEFNSYRQCGHGPTIKDAIVSMVETVDCDKWPCNPDARAK